MSAIIASIEQGDKVVEIKNSPIHTLERQKKSMQEILDKTIANRIALESTYSQERDRMDQDYQGQCVVQLKKADELDAQARAIRELWAQTVQNREAALKRLRLDFEKQDAALLKMIRSQEAMLAVLREE